MKYFCYSEAMTATIFWSLVLSLSINGGMFLVAFRLRSDKLTDASYALTFLTLTLFSFVQSPKTTYDLIATMLVCAWALRIGSFLLYRVLRTGKDRRFDGIRDSFWQFGKFWLGQAITVWILMIPITLVLKGSTHQQVITVLGMVIWLLGFGVETIADLQKYRFTHDPQHAGHWIDTGVWRYSRHPNYFGEIAVWLGVYLYTFPGLSVPAKIIGVLSPLVITILLLFVSGIPILEKQADERWGNKAAYQAYKQRTSLLVPLPPKQS